MSLLARRLCLTLIFAAVSASTAFADSSATSQPSNASNPWTSSPQLNGLPVPAGYPLDTTLVPDAQTVIGEWRVDLQLSLTMLVHLLDQRDADQLRELAAVNGWWTFTFSEGGTVLMRGQMGPEIYSETDTWTFVSGNTSQATISGGNNEDLQLWFLDENLCILESSREGVMFYLRRAQD